MPAKRKTNTDRMREAFTRMYRTGKAETGLGEEEVRAALGMESRTTLRTKRREPERFTFGEIIRLSMILNWDPSDVANLIAIMR